MKSSLAGPWGLQSADSGFPASSGHSGLNTKAPCTPGAAPEAASRGGTRGGQERDQGGIQAVCRKGTVRSRVWCTHCPAPQGRPPGTAGKGAAGHHPPDPGFGVCEVSLQGSHIDPKNLHILQGTMRTGRQPRALEARIPVQSPHHPNPRLSASQQTQHSPAHTHTSIMDYPLHFQGAPDRDLRLCRRP